MNTASPDDIDITSIWRSLRRSLPKLLIVAILLGGAAFGILSVVKPRYTSEAQIQVVPPKPEAGTDNASGGSADAMAARLDKEAINTHLRAIMSPDLAVEIIADEGLEKRPEFNSALQPPGLLSKITDFLGLNPTGSAQDRVLKAYYDRLSVYSPRESRFIGIQFTSQDPELAADVANRIAATYRSSLATRSASETDEMQKALQPKIDRLMKEVGDAEAAVENFRAQANIFKGGPNNTGLNEQRLSELNAELTKAQAARNQAEAHAASARDMVDAGNAESLSDVQKSPLIQNLVQQRVRLERQLSELSATLLPAHPRMRQLRADLAGLERQINSEVKKVIDGIEKNAKVAAMREEAVKKSLDEAKTRVVDTGGDEVKLRQLEATAKSKRAELERLQTRFEANRARADSRAIPIEAQIISKARPSSIPSFPKKLPYAALVAVAIFLFGIAIIVTRALFTAARSGGVAKAARSPAAGLSRGIKPELAGEDFGADGVVHTVDSVEGLARRLLVRPPDIGGFRTLMTGEAEGIDIGSDAVELASMLAASGADVMLVDWSLDGHGLAESIGAQTRPGIVELLQGRARFEDVVTRVPGSSAHLIPSGGAAPAGGESLLDPDKVNLALDALDTAYDHIVIVGRTQDARRLFEAIQGRFDAGVVVTEGKRRSSRTSDGPGMFLGFQVTDIELLRLERPLSTQVAQERLSRLTAKGSGQAGVEARSA